MKRTEICNRDCFHCQYEDCLLDELTQEDFNASARRDREALFDRKYGRAEKIAAHQKAYYEARKRRGKEEKHGIEISID